ncbi:MAG: acyltransferase [Bacteroides sp.]|nr:acyltransferase [Bacteroides sp.]
MSHLSNVRYGYFDALRGFTMILVVFSHVLCHSVDIDIADSPLNLFFSSFRMPLFFFVSGFFAFKPLSLWSDAAIKDIMSRKFKVQVAGTALFLTLFSIFRFHRLPAWTDFTQFALGYWFTFTLFILFTAYILTVMLARRLPQRWRASGYGAVLTMMAAASAAFAIYYSICRPDWRPLRIFLFFISPLCFYYLPYFLLGMAARARTSLFEKILRHKGLTLILAIYVITAWAMWSLGHLRHIYDSGTAYGTANKLYGYLLSLPTLLLVVKTFYSLRGYFDRETPLSNTAKHIGRRTLDIYFLHYFFLPDLRFMKPFFLTHSSMTTEIIIAGSIALIIVALTLLTGRLIRTSPLLAHWLLGARPRPPPDLRQT